MNSVDHRRLYRNAATGTKAGSHSVAKLHCDICRTAWEICRGLDRAPVSLSITCCNKVAYFPTGAGDGSRD